MAFSLNKSDNIKAEATKNASSIAPKQFNKKQQQRNDSSTPYANESQKDSNASESSKQSHQLEPAVTQATINVDANINSDLGLGGVRGDTNTDVIKQSMQEKKGISNICQTFQ